MNTNKTIEELLPKREKIPHQKYNKYAQLKVGYIQATSYNQAIDDVLLALPAIKNAIYEEVEEKFDAFRLTDWSGEAEVYAEINRLKEQVLSLLKPKE